ncbi:protein-serine/threonine phosphatase KNAG_0M00490 [Huiozyma naganishii CBS 8797]|uniref:Serine/threonine-protein phosphatase n=1 Tax=Huiozyma naganishii (strain ATCC MYA-139 / BCRC 22969 / CBS 8797 / KCTC 17520 / NBRC 10181 / NCYC 3082 / Yp74L-3) TaxID=1071383 RepID=J7S3Y6_HUIN7|nr:hypothetical protein KNAG_0M00490 [Kazachstania naganishii CBS 8797]CCK72902.1 hypothetical protein KNAG_0M00490 [Kazachstania naganishii CBS 8797]
MRRKRSPSNSNHNFAAANSNSASSNSSSNNNQSSATGTDDLNANEPNDPDDSRSTPTIINNIAGINNTKNNDVSAASTVKNVNNKRSASPDLATKSSSHNEGQEGSLKELASPSSKAKVFPFAIPKVVRDPRPSISTTVAMATPVPTSASASSSAYMDSAGSTPFSSVLSSSSSVSSSSASYMRFNGFVPSSSSSSSASASSLTFSLKGKISPNLNRLSGGNSSPTIGSQSKASGKRSVFLKRYPHDRNSKEGVHLDDMIAKLIQLNERMVSAPSASSKSKRSASFPFHTWEIQLICSQVREVFLNQPTLLKLQSPIKIVGDIHGQFNDLLRIFKLSGDPRDTNYLFLGDYVDRGKQSLETIMLLFCYKLKYRDNFFMLRGNHESANITKMYGFYDECKRRKSTKLWRNFVDVFNCLPIAAVIQDKIFCVHGGISPELNNLKQITNVARPTDIPENGLVTDLLWSDPDQSVANWTENDRGVSYTFSKKNVLDFCSKFKFDLIIRGHMVVEDGYEFFARKKFVTVFSAPNYCGQFGNWGAVLSISTGLICSFELLKPHSIKKKAG